MGIRKISLPQAPTIEGLVQIFKLACTVPCRISEITAASARSDTGPAKDLLCAPEMVLTESFKGTNLSEKVKGCKEKCVTPRSLICKFSDELHHHQTSIPLFPCHCGVLCNGPSEHSHGGWFYRALEFGGHFDTNDECERLVSAAFTGTTSLLPTLMLPCLAATRGARKNGARGNPPTVLHSFSSLSSVMFLYTGSS